MFFRALGRAPAGRVLNSESATGAENFEGGTPQVLAGALIITFACPCFFAPQAGRPQGASLFQRVPPAPKNFGGGSPSAGRSLNRRISVLVFFSRPGPGARRAQTHPLKCHRRRKILGWAAPQVLVAAWIELVLHPWLDILFMLLLLLGCGFLPWGS